jgi:hypothetical protein
VIFPKAKQHARRELHETFRCRDEAALWESFHYRSKGATEITLSNSLQRLDEPLIRPYSESQLLVLDECLFIQSISARKACVLETNGVTASRR